MAVKQISNNFSIAGQITPEELERSASEGFKSIINLRSPLEEGFIPSQQQQAESIGLEYANMPVKPSEINDALVTEILSKIDDLPKPILIHCASGFRAGAIAFMHLATRENLNAEQAFAKTEELGFDCSANPQLKQFMSDYVTKHQG